MSDIHQKKLSIDLALFFVEKLVTSFQLENDLISANLEMKEKLNATGTLDENMPDRTSIKFLFNNGVPFEPTKTLRQILEDLINDKITFQELSSILEKKFSISKEDANSMTKMIQNNPTVIQEKNATSADYSNMFADIEEEFATNSSQEEKQGIPTTKTMPKGINQDLL